MSVQTPTINVTTPPGLLAIVANNAAQQIADEALIASLQATVAQLQKSYAPPGAYAIPVAGSGLFPAGRYSAGATPWGGTQFSEGNIGYGLNQTAANNTAIGTHVDVWDAANNIDIVVGPNNNGTVMAVQRVQRYSNRAPTILGSTNTVLSLSSQTAIMAVTILSPTTAKVTAMTSAGNSVSDTLVTWNGTTLSQTNSTNVSVEMIEPVNKRGFLAGSASIVHGGHINYVSTALSVLAVRDRNNTAYGEFGMASHLLGTTANIPVSMVDAVGSGYFLRTGASFVASDQTIRPAVHLEYVDDFNVNRIATLRIPSTNFGGWNWLAMVSNTLAIGQYRDVATAGKYYTIAISVNPTAATPLGLYGPFTTGIFGSSQLAYPAFFGPNDSYWLDLTTATTGTGAQIKLRHINFNPANVGSELSLPGNDPIFNVGATNAGTSGSGAALTTAICYSGVQYGDQYQLAYFGNTGTATTTGAYLETFNLTYASA